MPPAVCLKQNLRRLRRRQSTLFRATILGSVEPPPPPPLGSGPDQERPPWMYVHQIFWGCRPPQIPDAWACVKYLMDMHPSNIVGV